jgi:hypothetical protein
MAQCSRWQAMGHCGTAGQGARSTPASGGRQTGKEGVWEMKPRSCRNKIPLHVWRLVSRLWHARVEPTADCGQCFGREPGRAEALGYGRAGR